MKQLCKLALIQMDCTLGDVPANLEHALELGRKAVAQGANLLVFPELFTTGYELSVLGADLCSYAEDPSDSPTLNKMRDFAIEHQVSVCGVIPLFHTCSEKAGKPNISCFYINSEGKLLGIYDKNHLFGEEKDYFSLGESYPVLDTEFGRIGIMICYDANFPEPARILACQGAEIILCPAAWRVQDIRLFDMIMPQRAAENIAYVCAVNRYGMDHGRYNPGHSKICSPEGEIIAFGGASETIIYAELHADTVTAKRKEIPYLNDLRTCEYPVLLKDLSTI